MQETSHINSPIEEAPISERFRVCFGFGFRDLGLGRVRVFGVCRVEECRISAIDFRVRGPGTQGFEFRVRRVGLAVRGTENNLVKARTFSAGLLLVS